MKRSINRGEVETNSISENNQKHKTKKYAFRDAESDDSYLYNNTNSIFYNSFLSAPSRIQQNNINITSDKYSFELSCESESSDAKDSNSGSNRNERNSYVSIGQLENINFEVEERNIDMDINDILENIVDNNDRENNHVGNRQQNNIQSRNQMEFNNIYNGENRHARSLDNLINEFNQRNQFINNVSGRDVQRNQFVNNVSGRDVQRNQFVNNVSGRDVQRNNQNYLRAEERRLGIMLNKHQEIVRIRQEQLENITRNINNANVNASNINNFPGVQRNSIEANRHAQYFYNHQRAPYPHVRIRRTPVDLGFNPENGTYFCLICRLKFIFKTNLVKHMKEMHDNIRYYNPHN